MFLAILLGVVMVPDRVAASAMHAVAADATPTIADVGLLIAYFLLALIFSFLCSIAEAVLLSITPSYIESLTETHPKRAKLLRRLKQDNVDQSLAAILTLNTIAHTVGALGAGAKATVVFGSAWLGLFSAVMTLMILFLSEIVPKTLGVIFWRGLAGPTALFVRALIVILYPLIRVSEVLTKLIARGRDIHPFSRHEFLATAAIGEEAGQIDEQESKILRNLFDLRSLKAKDVMTPRSVILAFSMDQTVDDVIDSDPPFSRLPVHASDLDHPVGFALKHDVLLSKATNNGQQKLKSFIRKIPSVPGEMGLPALMEFLLDQRQHIALVVNEYGSTQGLVTLEDVVETLLGTEIVDEMDTTEDMQTLARQQWAKRAETLDPAIEVATIDPTAGAADHGRPDEYGSERSRS